MIEKTLFLFELVPKESFFFDLVFDAITGREKITRFSEPMKDWTHFIKCGFIL